MFGFSDLTVAAFDCTRYRAIVTTKMSTKAKARTHVRAFGKSGGFGRRGPDGLFVLFRLFLRRRQALEALQQLFLGHPLDGDFGVVGIDAGPGRPDQGHGIGLRLVDFDEFLQGMNQFLTQILGGNRGVGDFAGETTTGFLSLSRSTVSCDPEEIVRARCAANRTRSNRLSTLSMQSSTVTRAIDCRSVKWDECVDYAAVIIGPGGFPQGQFVICLPHGGLVTPPRGQNGRSVRTRQIAVQDKKSLHCLVKKVVVFSPLPHHIWRCLVGAEIHGTLGSKS